MSKIDDLEKKVKTFLGEETDPDKIKEGAAILKNIEEVKAEELDAAKKHADLAKSYREAILTTAVDDKKTDDSDTKQEPKSFEEIANEAMAKRNEEIAKQKSVTLMSHGKGTF
jgi:hypothetical protein